MSKMQQTLLSLALIGMATSAYSQTKNPKPAAKPKTSTAKTAPSESLDAQAAKKAFAEVLDAVDASWFGKPYQGVNALEMNGHLNLNLSASAVNAKVQEASQGLVKNAASSIKTGNANLQLKGVWLANGDFRCELAGDGGEMVYSRVANKGFLYHKQQNAYTTRVDLAPSDAPLTFMGWFRQNLILEAKSVYCNGAFKATLGDGDDKTQTLVFNAPTGEYDPKKREQSLDDTLSFWKRGRLEVTYDKTTKLPQRALFQNAAQGVKATMTFAYGANQRLASVTFDNQSKGMEGPMSLRVDYGNDGLMKQISGELAAKPGRIAWDLAMSWEKGRKLAASRPPANAEKKGKEDLQAMLYIHLAGQVMELQRLGLNLRSPALSGVR